MPGLMQNVTMGALTMVMSDPDGIVRMRPVNDQAKLVWLSGAKAYVKPRTILEGIQHYAPTRSGYELAQKAITSPTVAFKAVFNAEQRTLVAIVSRANYTDSQGDFLTRDALTAAVADINARGVSTIPIDQNHRDLLPDVTLQKAFMGGPALPAPYDDPDCFYGQFSFADPSPTWGACRAGRCVGFSWFGTYSR